MPNNQIMSLGVWTQLPLASKEKKEGKFNFIYVNEALSCSAMLQKLRQQNQFCSSKTLYLFLLQEGNLCLMQEKNERKC